MKQFSVIIRHTASTVHAKKRQKPAVKPANLLLFREMLTAGPPSAAAVFKVSPSGADALSRVSPSEADSICGPHALSKASSSKTESLFEASSSDASPPETGSFFEASPSRIKFFRFLPVTRRINRIIFTAPIPSHTAPSSRAAATRPMPAPSRNSPTEKGKRPVMRPYAFTHMGKTCAIYQSEKAALFHAAAFSPMVSTPNPR